MKRILGALALLAGGMLAGALVSGQVNGQGGVYINGVLQGVGSGSGTVTSVGITLPAFMNVSGTNPITSSGTFTLGLANVSSTLAFLGPATGSPAAPTFRAIATTDLASPDASGVLTSNGSGALSWSAAPATGANTALSNLASVAINAPLVTGVGTALTLGAGARTTDAAPSTSLLKAGDAFPGAATNVTGANTILAGGIGKRIFTIVAYDHGSMAGSTVTLVAGRPEGILSPSVVEGVDWTAGTSNGDTAISLAAAIHYVGAGWFTAAASGSDVRITPVVGTYSLTIAKTAADAGMTATSGIDGVVNISGPTYYGTSGTMQLGTDTGNGRDGLYLKHVNSDSAAAPYQYAFLVPDYVSTNTGGYPYASLAGRALLAAEQLVLGPGVHIKWYGTIANNLNYINPRTGISESAGLLTITDGSTGYGGVALDANTRQWADTVTLSDNVKTAVLDIAIADAEFIGGTLTYTITATDATNHQALTGIVGFSGVRKAAAYSLTIAESASPVLAESSGASTLTDTWAIDAGTNVATISVTADSSLTTPTMTVRYQLMLNSANAVTKK